MSNEDNYLVEREIYHFYDQVMSNEYKLTQISKMSFLFSTDTKLSSYNQIEL